MPRTARKDSQSDIHHIMVQGINKEYIFKDELHINYYKDIILKKLESSNLTILAYCIMNNHSHFLIYSEKSEYLSKFMQKTNTCYSRFYNLAHKRVGYVFRDRFLSQDILNQNQLYNCLKYIHNNPVKAHMVKEPGDYEFSSYNEFLGQKKLITDESFKILFGSTKNYVEQFNLIHNTLCDENFIDIKDLDIGEFIKDFEIKNHIQISNISKSPVLLKDFICKSRNLTDVKILELAQILGISKSTVSKYINKEK